MRKIVSYLLLLGALALAVPAVTLASGGGSAGDQQYTDPFSTQPGTHKTTTHSTTTTAPATTPTAPADTTPATVTSDPGTATTPTATTASNTTLSTSAKTLPYTGYDSWLAGGLGLVLAGAGLSLRRKAQRG